MNRNGTDTKTMALDRAYLDYNASAPLRPQALAAMQDALSRHGNASSVHGEGRDMRRLIEAARADIAALVGTDVAGVTFTSSATEAAHLALTPDILSDGKSRRATRLLVLETEHPCILAGGRFTPEQIISIPVHRNGLVNMDALDQLLDDQGGTAFTVAVQLVNSETGIIQPVADIAQKVRFKGGYVVCDAVQAAGRLPIDVKHLGVDFLILSAHKFGGSQGVGALISAHSVLDIPAAIGGGGQEKNKRAGTENVAAIAGFGAAAQEAAKDALNHSKITAIRDSIEQQIAPICAANGLADRLTIFGKDVDRVGNTFLFSVEGLKAETALIAFDLEGVAVSSGSACSSGKVGNSHVLQAMGIAPAMAQGAVRVSVGWNTTQSDTDKFITAFKRIAKRLGETIQSNMSGAA